ncbi:Mobile element protein (plasmid) [Sinorhizobium sojae CCBAU 05684]|uniref:Mobile element protein n=1 Tax=Sinorhizobium sojae CCBAU 05684 TaxID=716928 RepID=A0A249PJQ8_9HYPH|nr:Mobile element protein [Sinorhizobium sojae CCBAU 05684]
MIGNPTIADAILDRLVHNASRIDLSRELAKAASNTIRRLTARQSRAIQINNPGAHRLADFIGIRIRRGAKSW